MARYDERGGTGYGADNRDRWRDNDRERSSWQSGGQGMSEREDERGFFQRAGDEIRSWFNEDEDRGPSRDYERGNYGSRSSWDRDNYSRSGSSGGGWTGGSSWDRDRSEFGGPGRGGQFSRSSSNWERGFGSRDGFSTQSGNRDRFGSSSRDFGGFRSESDFRGRSHRNHPQSWGEANRGENESLGYGDYSGALGGFGNQTVGVSEHDHYRNWRDREMSKLDRDYEDYCREREQQFNQDFDSWRRSRPSRNPTATTSSPDLGSSSNAGVGTTNASLTGSAGTGSAAASATGQGGTVQSDSGPAETGGRSGSRSRS